MKNKTPWLPPKPKGRCKCSNCKGEGLAWYHTGPHYYSMEKLPCKDCGGKGYL